MTPDPHYDMTKALFKKVEETNKMVKIIETSIVGDIETGAAGLQDKVRDLGSDVTTMRIDMDNRKAANTKDHVAMKRGLVAIGGVAFVGVLIGLQDNVPLIKALLSWLTGLVT